MGKCNRKRVTLEPELEGLAKDWNAEMRRIVARKFKRWARQLEISAEIMKRDAAYSPPRRLKFLSLKVAVGN